MMRKMLFGDAARRAQGVEFNASLMARHGVPQALKADADALRATSLPLVQLAHEILSHSRLGRMQTPAVAHFNWHVCVSGVVARYVRCMCCVRGPGACCEGFG